MFSDGRRALRLARLALQIRLVELPCKTHHNDFVAEQAHLVVQANRSIYRPDFFVAVLGHVLGKELFSRTIIE